MGEEVIVIARYDYQSKEPNELSLKKNDRFILIDDSKLWWLVQRVDSDEYGYIPSNFVKKEKRNILSKIINKRSRKASNLTISLPASSSTLPPLSVAFVRHKYEAQNDDELTLLKGTKVKVLQKKNDGWWYVDACSRKGWYPSNYLSEKSFTASNSSSSEGVTVATNTSSSSKESFSDNLLHETSLYMNRKQSDTLLNHSVSAVDDLLLDRPSEYRCSSCCVVGTVRYIRPAFSYEAKSDNELNVAGGEQLKLLSNVDGYWLQVENSFGQSGMIPSSIVLTDNFEEHNSPRCSDTGATLSSGSSNLEQSSNTSSPGSIFPPLPCCTGLFAGCEWYYGLISREDADRLLDTTDAEGSFLIRDSLKNTGQYSISVKAPKRNKHFKIESVEGNFRIGKKIFSSMNDLIAYYQQHPIFDEDGIKLYLYKAKT